MKKPIACALFLIAIGVSCSKSDNNRGAINREVRGQNPSQSQAKSPTPSSSSNALNTNALAKTKIIAPESINQEIKEANSLVKFESVAKRIDVVLKALETPAAREDLKSQLKQQPGSLGTMTIEQYETDIRQKKTAMSAEVAKLMQKFVYTRQDLAHSEKRKMIQAYSYFAGTDQVAKLDNIKSDVERLSAALASQQVKIAKLMDNNNDQAKLEEERKQLVSEVFGGLAPTAEDRTELDNLKKEIINNKEKLGDLSAKSVDQAIKGGDEENQKAADKGPLVLKGQEAADLKKYVEDAMKSPKTVITTESLSARRIDALLRLAFRPEVYDHMLIIMRHHHNALASRDLDTRKKAVANVNDIGLDPEDNRTSSKLKDWMSRKQTLANNLKVDATNTQKPDSAGDPMKLFSARDSLIAVTKDRESMQMDTEELKRPLEELENSLNNKVAYNKSAVSKILADKKIMMQFITIARSDAGIRDWKIGLEAATKEMRDLALDIPELSVLVNIYKNRMQVHPQQPLKNFDLKSSSSFTRDIMELNKMLSSEVDEPL